MTNPKDLKTIGLTPFSYHANEPLFRINAGVPVIEALSHASDLLHVAKLLASERRHGSRHRPACLGIALFAGYEQGDHR
ncbi:Protein of unknown function [Pseudomonas arsenicoxydans]|uniref:Uncharacterized protein n=1 Tax=Pseudomonas arsenicoxydans TaxID=702115 RepID=A0A1H0CNX9_9PSED|nr:Protein of unknown function [Pseudomonas arsenicoxydans]